MFPGLQQETGRDEWQDSTGRPENDGVGRGIGQCARVRTYLAPITYVSPGPDRRMHTHEDIVADVSGSAKRGIGREHGIVAG